MVAVMGKLKIVMKKAPQGTSFVSGGGFDLMGGNQPKPDIVGKLSTDNKVPPLVPGTGMRMGMSGRP